MANSDSSTSSLMVALVAILVIVVIGFIAWQVLPRGTDNGTGIDVNIDDGGADVTGGLTGGGDGE